MKFFKSFFAIVLCTLILSLQTSPAFAATEPKNQYNIDVAYEYPITPEMESEWAKLTTLKDKLAVCQIPSEILEHMTTDALIETVANYPLTVNLYAYDTLELGYKMVKEEFNGLAELDRRMSENPEEVKNRLNAKTNQLLSESQNNIGTDDEDFDLKNYFIARIKECLEKKEDIKLPQFSLIGDLQPNATSSYIKTPKGSNVLAYNNLTWSNHGITEKEVLAQHNAVKSQYSSVTIISGISPKYNCHSYAWYSTSTNNSYWINNPSTYITDGSYKQASVYSVGLKLTYTYQNTITHSAIVSGVSEKHLTYATSKWGVLGVYKHLYFDCPYKDGGVKAYIRIV